MTLNDTGHAPKNQTKYDIINNEDKLFLRAIHNEQFRKQILNILYKESVCLD